MNELIVLAKEAQKKSYSPYSNFKVGAALKAKNGQIYLGCNIENGAFAPSCCAERVAFYNAITNGVTKFEAIAIVGDKEPCFPCGVCRQVMLEFCDKDFKIIVNNKVYTLEQMQPYAFKLGE
ncbi:MAG: cytidine deaminase [Bacilli bacterium]